MVNTPPPLAANKKKLYIFIGGGGLIAWYAYHRYSVNSAVNANNPSDSTDTTSTDSYGDPSLAYDPTTDGYSPVTTGEYPPGWWNQVNPPTPTVTISTNLQWAAEVRKYYVNAGYNSTLVGTALTKYLTGQALNDSQYGIITGALALFGNPPTSVHAPYKTKAPDKKPPGRKVTGQFYRQISTGAIWQVSGGKRYHVSIDTWKKITPKPHVTNVTKASPIFKLPFGGNV